MSVSEQMGRIADVVERLEETARQRDIAESHAKVMEGVVRVSQIERFGLPALLSGIGGLAGLFERKVPWEFVAREDGGLEVSCPCGRATPVPEAELVPCACGRWFLYDGRSVRVALGPKSEVQGPR